MMPWVPVLQFCACDVTVLRLPAEIHALGSRGLAALWQERGRNKQLC